jgi:hypothetical protein
MNIRERILMIALSYVGQSEYGGDNEKYGDESFQKKLAGVGWQSGQAWCGYFQMLVWKEAYTIGNKIVPEASQEIQNLYNKAKTIPNPQPSQSEDLSKNYKKWAPVTDNQTYLTYVKPGDLVIFTSGHGEIALNINRDNNKKITSIDSIGGNWGDKVSKHSVKLNEIKGFAMVITA